ncbi:MAG: NADH-quinone oxidoreductase subunit J [Planctomycetaceae bacterium]|nr:NADH-quinone oxidoreductase subunit J [Planctomycetaceae bacterium]
MTGESLLFSFFALLTCLSAVAVVVSQTVVRMAFWLILALGGTAGLFFLADADFVGATQLLVYVGGTLVLLVFGVMLTASGPYSKIATSPGEVVVASSVAVLFLAVVLGTVADVDWAGDSFPGGAENAAAVNPTGADGTTLKPIGLSLIGVRPDLDLGQPVAAKTSLGHLKTGTGYLLPFEIASVHLLVVLVGAAYLARAKRKARVAE